MTARAKDPTVVSKCQQPTVQTPIRATAIKQGALSMAHMHASMTEQRDDTPAMRWGRLAHMAVLEPITLASLPQWDGGRKAGKEWAAFSECLDDGDDYVTADELDRLAALTQATRAPLASISPITHTEVRVDWTGELYGAATCRIDAVLKSGGFVEVKTCRNIEERAFLRQSYALHYEIQLGWYAHGLETTGKRGEVWVLAIESAPPYTTALYNVSPHILAGGYREAARIACAYRVCEAVGTFAGPYDDRVLAYELPEWARPEEREVDISDGEMEGSEL